MGAVRYHNVASATAATIRTWISTAADSRRAIAHNSSAVVNYEDTRC
jgi:hypothetical protein